MAGPLTQLGNVFYEGSRDYARLKIAQAEEERRRQQKLEDEARQRQFQLDDRASDRQYEQELFERNRQAALVDTLVRSGLLAPDAVQDPTAIAAALKRLDPDHARAIEELAGYKTAIPQIINAIGNTANVQSVLGMGPEQIDQAREIMKTAYGALAARVEEDRERGLTNAKNGAALIALSMNQLSAIQKQVSDANQTIERLQAGDYPDELFEQAQRLALQARPDLKNASKEKIPELQAEVAKQASNLATQQIHTLSQQMRNWAKSEDNIRRQIEAVGQLSRTGALAFLPVPTDTADTAETPTPAPSASAPSEDAGSALGDFANELSATPGVMKTNPNQGAASEAGGNVFTPGEYVRHMRAEADARDAKISKAEKTRMAKEAYDKAVDFEFSQLPEAEQKRIDLDRFKRIRSERANKERNRYNYENPFTGGPF